MVSKPAAFAYCTTARCPSPPIPEHSYALMRLGIGPAESAIDGVTGTEDRGRLLIGNRVRNQGRWRRHSSTYTRHDRPVHQSRYFSDRGRTSFGRVGTIRQRPQVD